MIKSALKLLKPDSGYYLFHPSKLFSCFKRSSGCRYTRHSSLYSLGLLAKGIKKTLGDSPLLQVLPLKPAKIGILITGTEIVQGMIKDKFEAIIRTKVKKLGCSVICALIVPDDRKAICSGICVVEIEGRDKLASSCSTIADPGMKVKTEFEL